MMALPRVGPSSSPQSRLQRVAEVHIEAVG